MGMKKPDTVFYYWLIVMAAVALALFIVVSVLQVLGVWPSGWELGGKCPTEQEIGAPPDFPPVQAPSDSSEVIEWEFSVDSVGRDYRTVRIFQRKQGKQ